MSTPGRRYGRHEGDGAASGLSCRRKDEGRRLDPVKRPHVDFRGPDIEACLVRCRADAPQAIAHDSHRMHIRQQLTQSSSRVTHSTKPTVEESVADPWAQSGPRGPHVYTRARAHTMYIYIVVYVNMHSMHV